MAQRSKGGQMLGFLAKRVLNYAILATLATAASYLLVSNTLRPTARFLDRSPPVPQETIDTALNGWGVNPDVPILQRLATWMYNLFSQGSTGISIRGQEVTQEIFIRAGTSLRLLIIGTFAAAILGVALGVWGAVRQYRLSDQVITYSAFVALSTPPFVLAVMLMIGATNLNQGIGFQLINFVGEYSPGVEGFWPQIADRAVHLLLPTLVLTILGAASYSRYQRSAMLDVLSSDYIRTARSKGLSRNKAIVRHGVRVALIPMSTFFAYSFGTMLAGATFTEVVFSWNGMGAYFIDAIRNNDINAATGTVLFNAILVLIAGTLADVVYAMLDPRVRL